MLRHNSTLITDTIYRTVSLIFPKASLIEHTVHSTFTCSQKWKDSFVSCATFSIECEKNYMYWLKINDCTNSVARVDFIHGLKRLCCMVTDLEWNNFHHLKHIQSLHIILYYYELYDWKKLRYLLMWFFFFFFCFVYLRMQWCGEHQHELFIWW